MKFARVVVCTLFVFSLLLGGSVAQTTQLPSAIPSGSATNGYGPYDWQNQGTALKAYKMACFEAQPGSGQDTCIFRDYVGHLSLYAGNGSTFLGGLASVPGVYQGVTSVPITDTAFHALIAAAADIPLQAASQGVPGKTFRIHADGVYTNAAASLLNAEVMLCQTSGCASGTVVAPAGCAITTTNQANNLTNGQFSLDCTLIASATVGASGTFMAKGQVCANLGTATSAVSSCFNDTATAVSAAVDETKQEFINVAFKFSTSNAGNTATVNAVTVFEN